MIKILFVCMGNICRSPMAEFVMKEKVKKAGLADEFEIASAAIEDYNIGDPVYPPAKAKLAEHGISCSGKKSQLLVKEDYAKYDYIITMENWHIDEIQKICGNDDENKISLMLEYTDEPGNVADPWYTRDFETTWNQVNAGCDGLLKAIMSRVSSHR